MELNKKLLDLIKKLEKKIKNPKLGLPEDFFLFLTRVTPMINVDLLIKNHKKETLLTWRQPGEKYPAGWHVPGGIIRFNEKAINRVSKVAKLELGCSVKSSLRPIFIKEIFLRQRNRSHFISLLYKCTLRTNPNIKLKYDSGQPKPGQWMWHKKCPKNLIKPHKIYKKFL